MAATRTEADCQAWRDQRDWTAWKDRMHDVKLPMRTQRPEGIARCFCGEVITNATPREILSLCAHEKYLHQLVHGSMLSLP